MTKRYEGFVLVEILIAVTVLTSGIVMLYQAFSTCLDVFSYSLRRLDAQRWIDEKIWQMQDELVCSGTLAAQGCAGSFTDKNKNFNWSMCLELIDQAQDSYLYELTLQVSWKQAQRTVNLAQVAYVQN